MKYIQRKDKNYLETDDQFETLKEARKMVVEYSIGDSSAEYYISNRACKDWKKEGIK